MALIKCPECGKEISDKAVACPNCGCPIASNVALAKSPDFIEKTQESPQMQFPSLPTVMNVGKQIVNWGLDAAIQNCYYVSELNNTHYINEGKVDVLAHTNGICIHSGLNFFYISHEQIISMNFIRHEELATRKKSVIGRAAVGGIILGPIGAIVGGISGIGNKQSVIGNYLLVINFWDVYTHSVQSILISTQSDFPRFIQKVETEKEKHNVPEGNNYVCNVLDEFGNLSDSKVIEALKVVGEDTLSQQIAYIDRTGKASALAKIRKIGAAQSVDTTQYQSQGCSVTLLAIITFGAALGSLLINIL